MALAICKYCEENNAVLLDAENFEEKISYGISAMIEGKKVCAGNTKYIFEDNSVDEKNEKNSDDANDVTQDVLIQLFKTTKEFGESTVSKILELVENASSRKSKSENFISKFARKIEKEIRNKIER